MEIGPQRQQHPSEIFRSPLQPRGWRSNPATRQRDISDLKHFWDIPSNPKRKQGILIVIHSRGCPGSLKFVRKSSLADATRGPTTRKGRMTRRDTLFVLITQARTNGFDFRRWFRSTISPSWTEEGEAIEIIDSVGSCFAFIL